LKADLIKRYLKTKGNTSPNVSLFNSGNDSDFDFDNVDSLDTDASPAEINSDEEMQFGSDSEEMISLAIRIKIDTYNLIADHTISFVIAASKANVFH